MNIQNPDNRYRGQNRELDPELGLIRDYQNALSSLGYIIHALQNYKWELAEKSLKPIKTYTQYLDGDASQYRNDPRANKEKIREIDGIVSAFNATTLNEIQKMFANEHTPELAGEIIARIQEKILNAMAKLIPPLQNPDPEHKNFEEWHRAKKNQ